MEWNVEISWLLNEQRDTEGIADRLMSTLSALFPAVAVKDRLVRVTATLEADTLSAAFTVVSEYFRKFFEDEGYLGNPSRLPCIALVRLRRHADGNEYSPDGGRSRSRRGARSIKTEGFRTFPPKELSASRR